MLVYMLETRRGSPDCFTIVKYQQGNTYNIPQSLGTWFLERGWAIETAEEDIHNGLNGVTLSVAEAIDMTVKQNLSAAESIMPFPNPAAHGMPRVSTMMREMDGI